MVENSGEIEENLGIGFRIITAYLGELEPNTGDKDLFLVTKPPAKSLSMQPNKYGY